MVKPLETAGSGVSAAPITDTTASTAASLSLVMTSDPSLTSAADSGRTSWPLCGMPLTVSAALPASSARARAASSIQACSCVEV